MAGVRSLDFSLARLRWEATRYSRQLFVRMGWGGLGGLFFGLLALVLSAWSLQQRWHYTALQDQLAAGRLGKAVAPRTLDVQTGLEAFQDYLPAREEIPHTIRSLIDLAESLGVLLRTGEYKAQNEESGSFLRYRISLPVKGDAGAIQDFLLAALTEHRTLALESVAFKREGIGSGEVEARIQFVLLAKVGSAPAELVVANEEAVP